MATVANIKIEPMNVTWGTDVAQVQDITCVADVSSSLNNKYFFIYATANATKYHVWYNVAAGGSDPAPAGSTAVPVAISANASATDVATATASAIDGLSTFAATSSGAVVTATNSTSGYASQAHEGLGTGFSFALTTEGDTAADIGYIDGDIEVTMEPDLVDVGAHQVGTNVLSQIKTGSKVEAKVTFKETTVSQLKKLIRQTGSSYNPVGTSATEVTGWGMHKDFLQTLVNAKKLVMHPVVLGSSDHSRDITIPLAYAMLEGLTFSGENIFMVPVTFKAYPKVANNNRVQYIIFGDSTQTLT